jgi:hypothetical protein
MIGVKVCVIALSYGDSCFSARGENYAKSGVIIVVLVDEFHGLTPLFGLVSWQDTELSVSGGIQNAMFRQSNEETVKVTVGCDLNIRNPTAIGIRAVIHYEVVTACCLGE